MDLDSRVLIFAVFLHVLRNFPLAYRAVRATWHLELISKFSILHDCILPRFGCSISTMVFLGVAVKFYYFLLESLLCKLNVFIAFHE
jgi:hypothetical protein